MTGGQTEWMAPAWWDWLSNSIEGSLVFGPLQLHERPLMLAAVVMGLLLLSAPAVFASRNPQLRAKWLTWLAIGLILGPLMWLHVLGAVLIAVTIAILCSLEYAKLLNLTRVDIIVLICAGVTLPLVAYLAPDALFLVPLLLLLTPLVPMMTGDTQRGALRTAYLSFGIIWLAWAPTNLVLVYHEAFLIALTVAVTDVASWVGGKTLGKLPVLRRGFNVLSPNKTIGGLVGGTLGSLLFLFILGEFSWGLWIAVAVGAPLGDLVESMFKRQAGVKDAGTRLPGFGGLLDRVDSLLLVLPLVAVLAY